MRKVRLLVLNGPNLGFIGVRQPEIYGRETLEDVASKVSDLAEDLGLRLRALQSNHEGQLIDWIHEARGSSAGIIINPGAYSHTSIAILDKIQAEESACTAKTTPKTPNSSRFHQTFPKNAAQGRVF